jgi:hypothetical protein
MNLLTTDLAAMLAAVLVAGSALVIRWRAHARHEARVRRMRDTTAALDRRAAVARSVHGRGVGPAEKPARNQVFPA